MKSTSASSLTDRFTSVLETVEKLRGQMPNVPEDVRGSVTRQLTEAQGYLVKAVAFSSKIATAATSRLNQLADKVADSFVKIDGKYDLVNMGTDIVNKALTRAQGIDENYAVRSKAQSILDKAVSADGKILGGRVTPFVEKAVCQGTNVVNRSASFIAAKYESAKATRETVSNRENEVIAQ